MTHRTFFFVAFASALDAVASQSRAQDILVDFEGLPSMPFVAGNPIPTSARLSDGFLTTFGVRFSSGMEYVAVVELGAGHATSGVNGIGGSTDAGNLTYNMAFPVTASFFDPANPSIQAITDFVSVRGDLIGNSSESPTLFAYGVNGELIGSDSELDTGGQTMSISVPGIHSVRFSGVAQPDTGIGGVALDDFGFNEVTVVPEPASGVLLVALVAGGAMLPRRRKQAQPPV
jgi:hypothetical protein